ncbi:MAG: hypothetical protein JXQ30_11305 [Spirochaetes bacterium]|nr:hypothetical protein [Spirochaetota bacterium]
MWIKVFIIIIVVFVVGIVLFGLFGRVRLDRENDTLVEALIKGAEENSERVFHTKDLDGLPSPVIRYLSHVLVEGQPYVRTVRLEQKGEFRLGGRDASWKPFRATQHFTVDPPGFIWEAKITVVFPLSARVVDMYVDRKGLLRAKILSVFTVVEAGPGPEMNEGELLRYLAESVWFPTALLPGEGVSWTPMDERSARASLTHEGNTVSLVFYFNDRDEVERVYAEKRFRKVNGSFEPAPWTGRFGNYGERNGMLIPLDGEVAWNLPDGDLGYWRGRIEEIEHRP